MEILFIIILIVIIYFLIKTYLIKYDTVIAFTGGLGSGKSFMSVNIAKMLYRKNCRKVKWHNFFEKLKSKLNKKHNASYISKPLFFSSIPIRINKKQWTIRLTAEHLLLVEKIPEKSIVLIDEVGSFASQFDYQLHNVKNNFDEFIRLFRHYTKGGYLVVNDQCSENIVLQIRRRINTVFNLMHFRVWLGLFYTVKIRNISVSEEIKTIEEQNTEDNMKVKFGLMPLFRSYDTYCYSDRYCTVPNKSLLTYDKYKKNELLRCPKTPFNSFTDLSVKSDK